MVTPGKYADDSTREVLKDDLVLEARAKDLSLFYSKVVWLKVPKAQARAISGRPTVSIRCVDVNKRDGFKGNYRSSSWPDR